MTKCSSDSLVWSNGPLVWSWIICLYHATFLLVLGGFYWKSLVSVAWTKTWDKSRTENMCCLTDIYCLKSHFFKFKTLKRSNLLALSVSKAHQITWYPVCICQQVSREEGGREEFFRLLVYNWILISTNDYLVLLLFCNIFSRDLKTDILFFFSFDVCHSKQMYLCACMCVSRKKVAVTKFWDALQYSPKVWYGAPYAN